MNARQLSYAQLTRDMVELSPEPLTVEEIVGQVDDLRPITTKNPKSTIRAAIGASAMIVHTGGGLFSWKTRVIMDLSYGTPCANPNSQRRSCSGVIN
jgi:hypothetical protein